MGMRAVIVRAAALLFAAGALSLAPAALTVGCGEQEATFTAQEFITEANRNGASLELGDPVQASGAEDEIYGLAMEPTPESAEGHDEDGAGTNGESHEHRGGSLRITENDAAAQEEHARCEGAATLLCYRAANVVVILEPEVSPSELARLTNAIRAMGSRR
jgi:hypothetical protein